MVRKGERENGRRKRGKKGKTKFDKNERNIKSRKRKNSLNGWKNQELEETRIEKCWFSIPSSCPANQFLSPKNTTRKCSKKTKIKKP